MKIGSGTFVPTAYFYSFVAVLFLGSGNALPIAAAPSIGNSKLSGKNMSNSNVIAIGFLNA